MVTEIMSDRAEMKCAGRPFHRLAAETRKVRLPTIERDNRNPD